MAIYKNTPPIVTNGLVLHLDAGSRQSYPGSGTTWTDLSGNANNGTLTNGPTFNTVNQGSIVFDGVDDYSITTLNSTPTLNITSGGITMESWIMFTALANASHGSAVMCKGLSGDGNSGVYECSSLPVGSQNCPFFRIRTTATTTYAPTDILMNLNQTYHYVNTYDGSNMRVYINGIQSGTGSAATGNLEANTQQLTIGVRYLQRSGQNSTSQFPGRMYVTRVYNRALSAQEVAQNYNALKSRFGLT